MFRLLRTFVGFLFASIALLAALIAAFAVIAMTLVWWREGHLGERDLELLRRGAIAAAVGGLCTWAGFRLAHSKRQLGDPRNASFTLVRSKDGRQEKFVAVFSGVVYLAGFDLAPVLRTSGCATEGALPLWQHHRVNSAGGLTRSSSARSRRWPVGPARAWNKWRATWA